ncbi:energy-coupling factor transporter transmembrane protein EcfT [Gelria sp. Kuro-4]|uniref:energy-coupling factor transporter transmembrane component T family protein n=1 Tax=Gelria sp. Kuro-4 TaxID=2796927 RepID=UPI001BEE05BF|nr:energy-coupling factor transporter transmembrane component T [Gelria sp. Kuro-4]MDI3522678.1 energy-coupling factor transport system permease protein [Bacillota bacterium]BCV24309.1 energy-coupling factor transporter transmembrane protein EcfT [Gelria sp. Kuro-4]
MLKDITLGQYIPGNSLLHRLDPRTKILGSILYIIALFVLNDLPGYVIITAFSFALIFLSGLSWRYVLRGVRPIFYIVLFTLVLNFFLTPGRVVWQLGPLKATAEGIRLGIFMGWRLLLLVLTTSLLTLTSSPIALTDGIEYLLNPFRGIGVPAHELAMMMTIALRFIPTLLEETDKIMKAQMARGADFETGNIVQRARGMIPLLVPLFVGAFRRADDLATAMEARCYQGGVGRTRLRELKFAARDFVALGVSVLLVVLSVADRLLH